MKLSRYLICGAFAAGALAPSPLRAQPAPAPAAASLDAMADPSVLDAPNIAGSDSSPWNRGVSQQVRAEARQVFLEGNRLFKIPLFSQAVEKYAEAIDKWKHPAFYFNLAIAEINLGQYLEARDSLEHAIQYGPEPLRADRFAEAKKQLIEVERHLGRLRVRVPTRDAEVSLDGVALFSGPVDREIWVSARGHEIAVKKPEYLAQSKRLTVAAGTRESVDVSLRRLVEERPYATWKPWAVIGLGVAVAGASVGLHVLSERNFSSYDEGFGRLGCSQNGCTQAQIDAGNPRLTPRLDRARLEQRIAVGGYIGGAAAITGGIILLYLNRPHLTEREDPNPSAAGVAVTPVLSTDIVGVQLTVSR
ncbi:MAG TPA: tetratricopeptide repeat protein [Kofleriaceae bacterium]|nr:tetratricopeptide repeat protein [Kofleriaceae bacterium]